MALLTAQTAVVTGVAFTHAAAGASGDTFVNTGRESVHIINGDDDAVVVTIAAQRACSHGITSAAAHDITVSIAAGADRRIGPFDRDRFNDADNLVHVTYADEDQVTIAVLG